MTVRCVVPVLEIAMSLEADNLGGLDVMIHPDFHQRPLHPGFVFLIGNVHRQHGGKGTPFVDSDIDYGTVFGCSCQAEFQVVLERHSGKQTQQANVICITLGHVGHQVRNVSTLLVHPVKLTLPPHGHVLMRYRS